MAGISFNFDLWTIINCVLLFIGFVLSAVGCDYPQVCFHHHNNWGWGNCYYLWGYTRGGYGHGNCLGSRIRAAYAFAILGTITYAFSWVILALTLFLQQIPKIVPIILVVATFVFLSIAWPISTSTLGARCDGWVHNARDNGGRVADGLGCLIAAWIMVIIVGLLMVLANKGILPRSGGRKQ